jgi:hypothetical protein
MSVWAWIAGIIAGVGIIFLIGSGDDDPLIAGRDREAFEERSAQALVPAPVAVGADVTLTFATADSVTPPDVKSSLEQVRQLLATAASQPPDQAKTTLEEAKTTLNGAIDATKDAADDTSNDATRLHLLALAHLLERIELAIQLGIDRL